MTDKFLKEVKSLAKDFVKECKKGNKAESQWRKKFWREIDEAKAKQ